MNPEKRSRIPLLLAGLIGCFILFLAWSANMASTGGTDVTDRDYYSKGLKYNSTLVEKKAASVIGWQLQSFLRDRKLTLILTDKMNRPIIAANGSLVLPDPGGNHSRSFSLVEKDPGSYSIELPPEIEGERLVRADFERDGARINRQLLLTLPASGSLRQHE